MPASVFASEESLCLNKAKLEIKRQVDNQVICPITDILITLEYIRRAKTEN